MRGGGGGIAVVTKGLCNACLFIMLEGLKTYISNRPTDLKVLQKKKTLDFHGYTAP